MKLVKRGAFALLLLSFVGTARCYNTDFAAAIGGMPLVGPMVVAPDVRPAYIGTIGIPAPLDELPDPGIESWWPENPEEEQSTLVGSRNWLVAAQTRAGWTELCGAASDAIGADRDPEAPELSALGCSDDASVTRLQLFAILVLRLDPETQMFLAGAPGSSRADFESTLAQIRVECTVGYASRVIEAAPVATACALPGAAPTAGELLARTIEVYAGLAAEIVALDPTVEDEPSFFETDEP